MVLYIRYMEHFFWNFTYFLSYVRPTIEKFDIFKSASNYLKLLHIIMKGKIHI